MIVSPSRRPAPFGRPARPTPPVLDERGEPRRVNWVAATIAILLLLALLAGPLLVFVQ